MRSSARVALALLVCVVPSDPALAETPPTAPPAAAAAGTDRAADRAALTRMKLEDWPTAYRLGDPAALARLLDESFRVIDGQGQVSTRDEELAWVAHHRLGERTPEYRIERLEFLGDDVALLAGLGTVRRIVDGATRVSRYRSTNVLVKRNGTWRAVASHVSMLPADAAGPAR